MAYRQDDMVIQNLNNNKKRKLQNEIPINKFRVEDLANEILYEIFDYLDMYYLKYFIINCYFPSNLLNNLLSCLPQLSHLSINSLVKSYCSAMLIKVKKMIKEFFYYLQNLRLTTLYDEAYLK
ncbi:unnamed protein product [Rotaria sp. Silwood1]|nr:unnamed protein product [Rotaria sp. Silwood1]CAF1573055.1 unnamed protein product [Rotaria sp. Silwood1]CAF3590010.1 unnamed protein product [Rotaria sp. Silwood1]CAF3636537.1 unnamed protein product [Rotaria sp. Silwood1]CAF4725952.1 unnamed protein product [Rotaria sp. Silwood1]